MEKYSAIILSGGRSSRMGKNKALLKLNNKLIIEMILEKIFPIFSNTIVVTNEFEKYKHLNVELVKDIYKRQGSLAGIHAGLCNSKTMYNFLIACDTPFISTELINYLLECSQGYDIVVPKIGVFLQPLYAVYSKNCISAIEDSLNNNSYKITSFYNSVKVKYIEEPILKKYADIEKVFHNINTPDDYKIAININYNL